MTRFIHQSIAGSIVAGLAVISLMHFPANAIAQFESAKVGLDYSAAGKPVKATVNADHAVIGIDFKQQAEFAVVRISGPGFFSISKRVENTDYISVDLNKDLDLSAYVDGEIDKQAVSGLDFLPDGQYTFEIMVHTADGLRHTTRGEFEVYAGSAFMIPSFDEISANDRELSDIRKPGILQRVASSFLDLIIPAAHADTADNFLTINDVAADDDTGLTFSNATAENTDFAIRNQDGNLRIFDDGGIPAPDATTLLNIVGSTGKVGFGTQNPEETIHLVTPNSLAGFRLEDSQGSWTISTGGFLSDLGFRIRNSSNGTTPFRIEQTAPTDSIRVTANGDVGLGTPTPATALHVSKDTTATIRAENTSGTAAERVMFQLINAGKTRFVINNTAAGEVWTFDNAGGAFQISRVGTGVAEFEVRNNGDVRADTGEMYAQAFNTVSSRSKKTDFKPVQAVDILDKVAALDITEWRYIADEEGKSHIGPMAEEFQELFGLGDGAHLNLVDTTGITLAAIQGLREEQQAKFKAIQMENALLRDQLADLAAIKAEL
ncbi:MAG TPA: tail fiber domain-containing protein, partial [Desulfuromonadales bacterium]|nr:tail fiber domain-containing protein [Desulfuromonadales bacterium]